MTWRLRRWQSVLGEPIQRVVRKLIIHRLIRYNSGPNNKDELIAVAVEPEGKKTPLLVHSDLLTQSSKYFQKSCAEGRLEDGKIRSPTDTSCVMKVSGCTSRRLSCVSR
jgi:hypothetical protein